MIYRTFCNRIVFMPADASRRLPTRLTQPYPGDSFPMPSWTKDLIQQVYGFSLGAMFAEADDVLQKLQVTKGKLQKHLLDPSISQPATVQDRERDLIKEHIKERLATGKYYQIRRPDQTYLVFQVICKNPDRRSYIQRICFLGKDAAWINSSVSYPTWTFQRCPRPSLIPQSFVHVLMASLRLGMDAWRPTFALPPGTQLILLNSSSQSQLTLGNSKFQVQVSCVFSIL